MEWQFIAALILAIPIVVFPAAFIWYLNISALKEVLRDTLRKRSLTHAAEQILKRRA